MAKQCFDDKYVEKVNEHLKKLVSERHQLEQKVFRRDEKISALQKALVELQLSVFREREDFLRVSAENEKLKRNVEYLHENIRQLLAITNQAELKNQVIYTLTDPKVDIGFIKEDFHSKTRSEPDIMTSQNLQEELNNLKQQFDEVLKISKTKSDLVLNDCKQALETAKDKITQDNIEIRDLKQRLQEHISSDVDVAQTAVKNISRTTDSKMNVGVADTTVNRTSKESMSDSIVPGRNKSTQGILKTTSKENQFDSNLLGRDQLIETSVKRVSVESQPDKPGSSEPEFFSTIISQFKDIHLELILFTKAATKVNEIITSMQATKLFHRIAKIPNIPSRMEYRFEEGTVRRLENSLRDCTRLAYDINNIFKSACKYVNKNDYKVQDSSELKSELKYLEGMVREMAIITADNDLINVDLKRSKFFLALRDTIVVLSDEDRLKHLASFKVIVRKSKDLSKLVTKAAEFAESIIKKYSIRRNSYDIADSLRDFSYSELHTEQLQPGAIDRIAQLQREPHTERLQSHTVNRTVRSAKYQHVEKLQPDTIGSFAQLELEPHTHQLQPQDIARVVRSASDPHSKQLQSDVSDRVALLESEPHTHQLQPHNIARIAQSESELHAKKLKPDAIQIFAQLMPKSHTDELPSHNIGRIAQSVSELHSKQLEADVMDRVARLESEPHSHQLQPHSFDRIVRSESELYARKLQSDTIDRIAHSESQLHSHQLQSHNVGKITQPESEYLSEELQPDTIDRIARLESGQRTHQLQSHILGRIAQSKSESHTQKLQPGTVDRVAELECEPHTHQLQSHTVERIARSKSEPVTRKVQSGTVDRIAHLQSKPQTHQIESHTISRIAQSESELCPQKLQLAKVHRTAHSRSESHVQQIETVSRIARSKRDQNMQQLPAQTVRSDRSIAHTKQVKSVTPTEVQSLKERYQHTFKETELTSLPSGAGRSTEKVKAIARQPQQIVHQRYDDDIMRDAIATEPTLSDYKEIMSKINATLSKVKMVEEGKFATDDAVPKELIKHMDAFNKNVKRLTPELSAQKFEEFSEYTTDTLSQLEGMTNQVRNSVLTAESQMASQRSDLRTLSKKLKSTEELLTESINECLALKQKLQAVQDEHEMEKYTVISNLKEKLEKCSVEGVDDIIAEIADALFSGAVPEPFLCAYCRLGPGHKFCEERIKELTDDVRKYKTELKLLQQEMKNEKVTAREYQQISEQASADLRKRNEEVKASIDSLEKRNASLLEQLKVEKNRMKNMERYRRLEIEGFQTDIKMLKSKIKDLEKQLMKAVLMFDNTKDLELLNIVHGTALRTQQTASALRRLKAKLYEIENDMKSL